MPRQSATPRDQDQSVGLSSGAYVGEIEFPATKSILWYWVPSMRHACVKGTVATCRDRRPLSEPHVVHAADAFVPSAVVVSPSAVTSILNSVRNNTTGGGGALDLVGHASFSEDVSATNWKLIITSFTPHRTSNVASAIPVYASTTSPTDESSQASPWHLALAQDFSKVLAATTTTNLRVSSELLTAYLSVQLVVSDITSTSVTVQASALGPQTSSLTLTPIRNLPLLLTPLAKLLMKPRAVSPSWWGYVTLDKTRKVVPLLQTDPLCASRPLVGVWVRSLSLSHMYLASMLFGTTSSRQTLWIAPRTFLLVKYPMQSTQWLPEFYECTIVADKALLGFFTSSQTAACDTAVEICMERRVFPATLPTSSLSCEDQVSTQENVVNTSVPPVVNSYRPEPPRNDTMSSFDMPTPMPERAPPIPPPQTKPILPPPPPPPGVIDDQPSGSSGGRNDVDLAALVHHQSRVMDAMQCEIQSLQRQLKAAMAPKTEKAEVGTNTSFAGETNALDCTTLWKGNDSDLDDDDDLDDRDMMITPPLVVRPAASQPPSSPSPSTSSPLAGGADFSFDVPRIQVPSAASTMDGQSDDDDDDDIAQIEARYLGKVKRAPLTT